MHTATIMCCGRPTTMPRVDAFADNNTDGNAPNQTRLPRIKTPHDQQRHKQMQIYQIGRIQLQFKFLNEECKLKKLQQTLLRKIT